MTTIDWKSLMDGLTGASPTGGVPVTLTIVPSGTLVFLLLLLAAAIFFFAVM